MAVSEASESPPISPGSTPSPINTPGLNGGGSAVKQLELSVSEDQALQTFLSHVNGWRTARGYSALTPSSGVKFVMARKFNVDRAVSLYRQHEMMRVREDLDSIDTDSPDLRKELETKKFTVLDTRDPHGAALALFNARLHDPTGTAHKTTLQGVIHQLDVALEDPQTQRSGLVFIYNMYGSKYSNFDYDLSQKMLTMLKGCYPARLKKVLIVTAPLWFKAPFKVLRLFVREKLRDRVYTVSIPQLVLHVPPVSLPKELGGTDMHDHASWLVKCRQVAESRQGQLVTLSCSQPNSPVHKLHPQLGNRPTIEQLESLPVVQCTNSHSGSSPLPPPSPLPENEDELHVNGGANGEEGPSVEGDKEEPSPGGRVSQNELVHSDGGASSTSDEDDHNCGENYVGEGHELPDFIEHVRLKGRRGLEDEYSEIRYRPPSGTFNTARSPENVGRNRYTDVLCYDHSRVELRNEESTAVPEDKEDALGDNCSDYINANYVDGYKQKRAFIFTQGPLPKTYRHFWQMVWEQRVQVIVMTTRTFERGRQKCGQYWPTELSGGEPLSTGPFLVSISSDGASDSNSAAGETDYVVTRLTVTNQVTSESREVTHFQFVSWPDYGVPDSALSMLTFLQRVRETQATATLNLQQGPDGWKGHPLGPPIVVHCSAGIGRTGTFATLDISIRKFLDERRVDIRSTVEQIRAQRAYSIQMPDQYVFCHLAFLEYALNMEHVEEIDLTGFDDGVDEYN